MQLNIVRHDQLYISDVTFPFKVSLLDCVDDVLQTCNGSTLNTSVPGRQHELNIRIFKILELLAHNL